jgi:aspartate aminotransferase
MHNREGRAVQNLIDSIPLGGIVSVRDRLIAEQTKGRKVFRLESGDPSFSVAPHILEAIKKALDQGQTHYPPGAGIPPLREAAFRKMVEANRIPLQGPQSVFITNGAMHALYVTFRALVDPGAEVIIPDPTWTETCDNVVMAGGAVARVRLDEAHGYRYDPAAIEAAVTPRTCAIVINSPHNPTGLVIERQDLLEIVKIAERHGLWIVSDEAYEHVLFDGREHLSAGSLGYDKVVSIFSMSKSYAMSGLRIGYLAVDDGRIGERVVKLLRDTINGVNSATQWGAVAALTGPQDATRAMASEYQRRRDVLWEGLRSIRALVPFKPQGAFYLWARIDDGWRAPDGRAGGWAMTEWLIDREGVGSAPGEVFGPAGNGHVRFAFSCATEQVAEAARRLGQLLG